MKKLMAFSVAAAALCAKSGKQPREIRAEDVRALIGGRDAD